MAEDNHTQPEWRLGERLARVEALIVDLQPQLDRRFSEHKVLFDEKLNGMRATLEASSTAQKQAVDKAEVAARRQMDTFIEQNDRKAEVTQTRLGALESDRAEGSGVAKYKAGALVLVGTIATVAVTVIYSIVYFH